MNNSWNKFINSFARGNSFSKLNELSTGVLYGGVITSDYTSNKVDIQEGLGQILIKLDNYEYIKEVSWATQIDYEITEVGTNQYTAIYVDSYGRILQKKSMLSNEELQSNVLLGIVFHVDNIKVNQIVNQKTVSLDSPMRLINLLNNLGLMKIEGLSIETNTGSLKLNRSEGVAFGLGVNYFSGSTNIDEIFLSGETNCSLQYVYRDGSGDTIIDNNGGTFYSNVIPGSYDDGSGVLQSVSTTEWSVQRCFLIPENPAEIIVAYGQNIYNSYDETRSSLEFEVFEEPAVLKKTSVFLGYMIVRGGAADLSVSGDCQVIQSGFIRNLPVGGGGGGGGTGTPGADGATWYTGTGVPSGALGVDDDLYLDTATSNVYKKVTGSWTLIANIQGATGATGPAGANGTNGTNGADGADGATWYTGTGVPSGALGVDDDLYLDTATSNVYKKVTGSWTLIATLTVVGSGLTQQQVEGLI